MSTILDAASTAAPSLTVIINDLDGAGGSQGWRVLTAEQRQVCEHFRDDLMLVFNFCDFGRADTQARMAANDVGVDARAGMSSFAYAM